MTRSRSFVVALIAATLGLGSPLAGLDSPEGYYRFPAIRGETVVFSAEGDLWTVPVSGGVARRLTTHHGEETDAAISPDGSLVAFTAEYEGPSEVYVMPIGGGVPKRLTWEAEPSTVVGFTSAGAVAYRTIHYSTLPDPMLWTVQPDTLERSPVPLAQASDGSWSADGKTIFFARPGFHRNNTKRYQGGTARDIWRYDAGAEEAIELTDDFPGGDHSPMVWGDRVAFVTDRDGTMNVWSMAADGSDVRQHTRHAGWDVKSPAIDGDRVVYQVGADLWLWDLSADRGGKIPIRLASDFDQLREKWIKKPMEHLTYSDLSPSGDRVVLTSRGRVFVAPAGSGRLVRLERQAGVRYRDASFMPDGERVVLLSDQTGELELYLHPADGVGEAQQLTDDGAILRFGPIASPDGEHIAFTDKNLDLWVLEPESGEKHRLNDTREGIVSLSWSPDGRWLAWGRVAANGYVQIVLSDMDTAGGDDVVLTSDRVNSTSPTWSPDGTRLYFLSDRALRSVVGSPWGQRQPEPYFDRSMKLYEVALRSGLRPRFRPADELAEDSSEKSKKQDSENGSEKVAVAIDREGVELRIWEVPVEPGNYRALTTDGKALYWLSRGSGAGADTDLMGMKITNEDPKPERLVSDVQRFELSDDRKKMLVQKGDALYVFDAEPQEVKKLAEKKVDLSGWTYPISTHEDLRQLFIDAWRLERDYFWDPGMNGVDWQGVRDKYLPLVDRVTTRAELSDLIGEVVGELSALHVSVRGGDLREGPDQIAQASLGAVLVRDPAAGGERIERIYRTDPDYPDQRGPLEDPYLGIEEGDVIRSVNGVDVLSVADAGVLLRDQAGRQVHLGLFDASSQAERRVIVEPTSRAWDLRYDDWELSRRRMVEQASNGEIGYLHLRAMGRSNLTEWYRDFYPVAERRGLIVDVRHNRGGNIDSILLEKLLRKAWFYWKDRVGEPTWNMQYAFRGHVVALIDQNTASDGEAFAEGFRRLGIGKLIGVRTWGGEIWLSSNNRLTDGGLARAPQTGVYGPEGEWLIEGWGVEPDIEVDNLPHETFAGRDRQLEAAIAHLQQLIAEDPRDVPPPPPYPDKSFRYTSAPETPSAGGGAPRP